MSTILPEYKKWIKKSNSKKCALNILIHWVFHGWAHAQNDKSMVHIDQTIKGL